MCGIVGGFWTEAEQKLESRLEAALLAMRHRGPDDKGYELTPVPGGVVAFGHTRLSIIDLTDGGHQPMCSPDGRYALVFNGEIYNYRELRAELRAKGVQFRSDSDTEVLLHSWVSWGPSCLERLSGMFAFTVHDRREQTLTCVRDAFGIKPFFYSFQAGQFSFASELSALKAMQVRKPRVDWQRSYDYLVNGDYDSQSRTFIDGILQLPPAHSMVVDLKAGVLHGPTAWWSPRIQQAASIGFSEAVDAVREQFLENIRLHLRSDVPLGAALSGGIDSSAVVCAMRHVEPEIPIHTFSYIAKGERVSEESWVDQVNSYVGASSHKVFASGDDLARDLEDLIRIQGEPFGSTSIYAQYRVFQKAKESGVTVTLDGQGADELLAGYNGYPGFRLLSLLEAGELKGAFSYLNKWSRWPGRSRRQACMYLADLVLPDGARRMARSFSKRSSVPDWLNSKWLEGEGVEFNPFTHSLDVAGRGRRVVERLGNSLTSRGLPGLLRHADRNSMRFSVESRVPFLTTSLADLLLGLPEDFLISPEGETKCVFRAAMRGIVPDNILDRKDKIGFETPEKEWLIRLAPKIREWLRDGDDIPIFKKGQLLRSFDDVVNNRRQFDWQVWRWINYCLWYRNFTV